MELGVLVLAFFMLIFGTINTLATKWQDMVVVGEKPDGDPQYFQHPAVQSAMMFLGELLCLIPYALSFLIKQANEDKDEASRTGGISHRRRQAHSWKAILAFSVPAICDACATTLLNVGLFYTYASSYQMLRGTLVFFAGLLTIVLLKRRLHIHNWLGMCLIVAGAALVGVASLIENDFDPYDPDYPGYDDDSTPRLGSAVGGDQIVSRLLFMGRRGLKSILVGGSQRVGTPGDSASKPVLGNLLVVVAQVAAATQFIIEEKFLTTYRVPALLAVGLEGFWGLLICAAACPLLSAVEVNGRAIDSFPDALREIRASSVLMMSASASIVSIALFNSFGLKVTKRLSGAARAAIDASRTLFIWFISLYLGWEPTHPPMRIMLQVVGFVVLLSGTSLYNELLRSCLPAPSYSPIAAGLQEPLAPSRRQQPPPGSGVIHAPRRAAPIRVDSYTMARSMRMPPQALSPHSLSSVRFQRSMFRNDFSFQSMPANSFNSPSSAGATLRWSESGTLEEQPLLQEGEVSPGGVTPGGSLHGPSGTTQLRLQSGDTDAT